MEAEGVHESMHLRVFSSPPGQKLELLVTKRKGNYRNVPSPQNFTTAANHSVM